MRINVSLDDEIMSRLDDARKLKGNMNRSAYISMALNTQMDQDSMIRFLPQIMKLAEENQQQRLPDALKGTND